MGRLKKSSEDIAHDAKAGQLLGALIEDAPAHPSGAPWTHKRLAHEIKAHPYKEASLAHQSILRWCNGTPINTIHIGAIIKALAPSTEKALEFITFVRPDMEPQWVREKLEQQDYTAISFPALDRAWLLSRPAQDRPNLLIDDCCARLGWKEPDLAKRLGLLNYGIGSAAAPRYQEKIIFAFQHPTDKEYDPVVIKALEAHPPTWFTDEFADFFRQQLALGNRAIAFKARDSADIKSEIGIVKKDENHTSFTAQENDPPTRN